MIKQNKDIPFFYAGDVAKIFDVHRTTVWRWINNDKLDAEQMGPNNRYWIVSLDSINKKKKELDREPLSFEDAMYYWKYGRLP